LKRSRETSGEIYGKKIIYDPNDRESFSADVDKFYTGDPYDDIIYKEAQRLFELSVFRAEKLRKELNQP